MSVKKLLLEQFAAAYDENGWFVATKNALRNLSAEEAAWKPENLENSIREILAHLNYYNHAYLERFKGVDYEYTKNNNDETFDAEGASDESWQSEVETFERIMNEWRELIEAAEETKFAEPVSAKNQSSWEKTLSSVIMHAAHHGGQIVLIRKLQGSWDTSKGVS